MYGIHGTTCWNSEKCGTYPQFIDLKGLGTVYDVNYVEIICADLPCYMYRISAKQINELPTVLLNSIMILI